MTLSALAAGLLNFGDRVGRVSAALFSLVGTWTHPVQGTNLDSRRDHALCPCDLPLACAGDPQPR